jgi:hypothetical protein
MVRTYRDATGGAHGCTVAALDGRGQGLGVKFKFGFGSGAGIRTLNLAVNRSLKPVQKCRHKFAECR